MAEALIRVLQQNGRLEDDFCWSLRSGRSLQLGLLLEQQLILPHPRGHYG